MIPPREISRLAHQLSLRDKTIEKDYLLSWVLLAIANSPLVKTALAGEDPNWGRIVMAVGKS